MIIFLKIRDLNTNRHQIWKYAICDIHLSDIKNEKKITFLFSREIHLINELKINMLLNNDIIDSKQIVFDVTKKFVYIDSIDVFITLNIRSSKIVVQRLIHLLKIIVVSSHAELTISIHNVNLSTNRNFLFESNDDIELNMYAHLIDVIITIILIRNDKNLSIKMFKNYRLEHVIEIDFSNVFHIQEFDVDDVKYLIIKEFKFIHQTDWFKKLIFVCVVVYAVTTAIVFDDVTLIDIFNASIIQINIINN